VRPDDLALLRTPGSPAVAPDGRIAVVAVTRPDVAGNGYRSQLWAVPTDASAPARPLTSGGRDTAPAFSPDGRWLAYLGAAGDEPPQLHVLPTAGGAPRRLTGSPLGAGAPAWSPDSRRLAWTARTGGPEDPEAPRLITALRFRVDGVGFVGDRYSQVHVLDLPDDAAADDAPLPEPVVVTRGDADCADVCWRPDGSELAFVSARHATADRDLRTDVFAVRPDGSGLRRITDTSGRCSSPAWSPDGAHLYVTALPDQPEGPDRPDGADGGDRPAALCRVPAAGGAPDPLPGPRPDGDATPATVLTDRGALVPVRRDGAVELLRVPLAGGAPEVLVDGAFTVRGFAAGSGVVVATVAHDGSAGELIAITPGRRRLLTAFGSGLGATGRVHRAAQLNASTPDGNRICGWVTVPSGRGPHPVVLQPAEPPVGWALVDEVQAAVSAGFAVVRCGPGAADGVLALLDAALADPELRLDGDRIGIAGGSRAAELAGRTGRFAAAVVEAVGELPAALLDAARTPTLVVHAEQDLRCPAEHGMTLYAALRRRGVPAELLLFPGEGHELPRSGGPRNRMSRLEHLLRWWSRWLTPEGDRAPGSGDH
jgi:dipeptidyl aminopeptidase/acylaminoacyl peptidase